MGRAYDSLTERERIFVDVFIDTCNATKAAEAVGYEGTIAAGIGMEWRRMPHIQEAMADVETQRKAKCQVSSDFVLEKLIDIARTDITQFFDDNNESADIRPKRLKDMPKTGQSMTVKRSLNGETSISIKTADRMRALELLGKHLGMYTENQKIEISLTDADRDIKSQKLDFFQQKLKMAENEE